MGDTIPLRCACGAVRGVVRDATAGRRLVCHCDDCQAYARWLRDGLTDAKGGTDVYQTHPARVAIEAGAEHLRCVRLSDKGLLRWYAGCCRTPIGNTLPNPRVPFVGVYTGALDVGGSADARLGPAASVFGKFAIGGKPDGAPDKVTLGQILGTVGLLGRGLLAGAHRPSPFFDDAGRPRVSPEVLAPAERERLRAAVAQASS